MSAVNLEKRIRRHVKAKEHRIIAVCHPDLEDLAQAELEALGFQPEREGAGVLAFSAPLDAVYDVHLHCRIPASFRIRLLEFRCGSREDLFRHIRRFNWEYWLKPRRNFQLKFSSRGTRLSHDGRAGNSAWKAVVGRMAEFFGEEFAPDGSVPESGGVQKILVRVEGTRATVSLDASGDLLYRRGWCIRQGKAPLRENLSAAIVNAAPFSVEGQVVDAMSGSGSFFGETLLSLYGLAPVPRRSFAFQDWPVYSPAAFENRLGRMLEENRRRLSAACEAAPDRDAGAGRHWAVEIDPDVFGYLKENLSRFVQSYGTVDDTAAPAAGDSGLELSPGISIRLVNEDFFAWVYQIISRDLGGQAEPSAGNTGGNFRPGGAIAGEGEDAAAGLILCNPPYDWRIPRSGGTYSRLWNLFLRLLPQWRGIVLIPLDAERRPVLERDDLIPGELMERCTQRDFPHGGRWVRAVYIRTEEVD